MPSKVETSLPLGAGVRVFLGTPSSANLATAVTDETGSGGALVFAASPTLTGVPLAPTASQGTSNTQIATTAYTDTAVSNAIAGVNPAVAVQAATTAAGDTSGFTYNNGVSGVGATLTGPTANVAVTIDGYTFTAVGQRLLVKNDTQSPSGAFNGVYFLSTLQIPAVKPVFTRALDYNSPSDINNTGAIPVVNGTVNASTSWLLTSSVTTVGTSPLTYTQFSINPTTLALTANPLSQFAATTSAQLRGVLSDENGTGAAIFDSSTSQTLITPILGTPTSGVLTNCTGTADGLTAGDVTRNHAVYAGASPPTVDVGMFTIAKTSLNLKAAGTTTIFTVPASRTFLSTYAVALVTAVTSGGAGTQSFSIAESAANVVMLPALASPSATPVIGSTYITELRANSGYPGRTCAAGANVQVTVQTSHAGSNAVTGTVFVTGFYIS